MIRISRRQLRTVFGILKRTIQYKLKLNNSTAALNTYHYRLPTLVIAS
jgi:hypothetical protein